MDMKVLETEVRNILIKRRDAGIEWISGDQPAWFKTIDLGTFAIKESEHCVLGQAYGPSAYGTIGEGGVPKFFFYHNHGFTLYPVNIINDLPYMGETDGDDDEEIYSYVDGPAWDVLNELWKEGIKALQSA